jgi:hypothetical protein
MLSTLFGKKPVSKGPVIPEGYVGGSPLQRNTSNSAPVLTYSKMFRWRLPDGQTETPKSVEVAGSFTHWARVPLLRDSMLDSWHAIIHHIQGNKTHHYMLFVDGQPVFDKTCDGYAIPHGPQEEASAMKTERGPRVLMLFGQTK